MDAPRFVGAGAGAMHGAHAWALRRPTRLVYPPAFSPTPNPLPTCSNTLHLPITTNTNNKRFLAWVLSISGAYRGASPEFQAACAAGRGAALRDSPWFRVPYPGQWGPPIISVYSTLTMLAGALPAMIESLGDYFAAAELAGAPVPPPDVLSRAVAWQGLCCVVTGVLGTSSGTTAYNENIDESTPHAHTHIYMETSV